MPTLLNQLPHRPGHRLDGQAPHALAAGLQPELAQHFPGGLFGGDVADDVEPLVRQPDASAAFIVHPAAAVIEQQARLEIIAVPIAFLYDSQAQLGGLAALFKMEGRIQFHGRQAGTIQQTGEHGIALAIGKRDSLQASELFHPGKDARCIEARDFVISHKETTLKKQG